MSRLDARNRMSLADVAGFATVQRIDGDFLKEPVLGTNHYDDPD